MKIGILAYHSVCNFGATLQLLSTFYYLKNNGHNPIVINWVPEDLEAFYKKPTPAVQYEMQLSLRSKIWIETELCRTSADVARAIEHNNIEAVIIGSDAVAQHHTFPENILFPTKRIFSILKFTQDRLFPNPFWGDFEQYLRNKIPIAFLSASSQDSVYKYYSKKTKKSMSDSLAEFSWISVRDSWTRAMFSHISDGKIIPPVTPDPVFAFNFNAGHLIPSENQIRKKFNIEEPYFLFSFENKRGITQDWINLFKQESHHRGIVCVGLPFSMGTTFGKYDIMVDFPITPLEWYSLIKYSCGYIGNNMHPIVVALHNAIPFYSFDNYGRTKIKGLLTNDGSSKINHILKVAGFETHRVSCINKFYDVPSPSYIISQLINFDKTKAVNFANTYYHSYQNNMDSIIKSFKNDVYIK